MSNTGTGYCHTCQKQVMLKKSGTNHLLHLILTLITGGFWLLIWFFCIIGDDWRCTKCGGKVELDSKLPEKEEAPPDKTNINSLLCPQCHSEINKNAKFCPFCGESLTVSCVKCKESNPLNAKFCTHCGQAFYKKCPECNNNTHIQDDKCSNCGFPFK